MKILIKSILFLSCALMIMATGAQPASEKENNNSVAALDIGDKLPPAVFNAFPRKPGTRLIILDFWSTWCSGCMAAFPKMENLQKMFDGKLQVVLVNSRETEIQIRLRLIEVNKMRKRLGREPIRMPMLPAINGDTLLKRYFPHDGVPHHVWIDENGKVLAITSGYNATPAHIETALGGRPLNLKVKKDVIGYDSLKESWLKPSRPELPASVFYSGFMRYFSGIGGGSSRLKDTVAGVYRITLRNSSVSEFYRRAFFSKVLPMRILVESTMKEKWAVPVKAELRDAFYRDHYFSYEISVPLKEGDKIYEFMQVDINRFFGTIYNVEGGWEKRRLKALILVQKVSGLLKTTGRPSSYQPVEGNYQWVNKPFSSIAGSLRYHLEDMNKPVVFVDETGFTANVDMQLTGDLSNLENVKKQVRKYGLDVVEGEREVDVVVIKDKAAPAALK